MATQRCYSSRLGLVDTNHKSLIFLAIANDGDDTLNYLRNLPEEAGQNREPLHRARREGLCELLELANATVDDIFRGVSGSRISRSESR